MHSRAQRKQPRRVEGKRAGRASRVATHEPDPASPRAAGGDDDGVVVDLLARVTPSSRAWEALCEYLDALRDAALMTAIEQLVGALEAWPDSIRIAPTRWLHHALRGLPQPRLVLARTLCLTEAMVRVHPRWLSYLAGAEVLAGARCLRIEGARVDVSAMTSLAEGACFARLEELHLVGCGLSWRGAAALARGLGRGPVRRLVLAENRLGDRGVETLAAEGVLRALTHLDLRDNNLSCRGVEALLRGVDLAWLEVVHLERNPIGNAGARCLIEAAERHPALRVHLSSGQMTPRALLRWLRSPLTRDARLDLSGAPLSLETTRLLATTPALVRVRHLDLSDTGTDDTRLATWLSSPHLGPLRGLSLRDNPLGEWGMRYLTRAPALAHLESLDLSGALNPRALTALIEGPGLRGLRALDLRGVPLDAATLRALTRAPWFATVERLDLRGCSLDPEAMQALASAEHLTLERLLLDDNPIGDDGLRALLAAPWLRGLSVLSLTGCGVGPRDARTAALLDAWLDRASAPPQSVA